MQTLLLLHACKQQHDILEEGGNHTLMKIIKYAFTPIENKSVNNDFALFTLKLMP